MSRLCPRVLTCVAAAIGTASLSAQQPTSQYGPIVTSVAPPPSDRFPASWYPPDTGKVLEGLAPVLDKPFTATVEDVSMRMSPSGKSERSVQYGFEARDRFGRFRVETESSVGFASAGKERNIVVADPVAHCSFTWTETVEGADTGPHRKIAEVMCDPLIVRFSTFDPFWNFREHEPNETTSSRNISSEHLSPVQVDGLTVQRIRSTSTIVDAQGNPQRTSVENWFSPELNELVRSAFRTNDDYTGLTHIRREDPDPKLFYPPADFQIVSRPRKSD